MKIIFLDVDGVLNNIQSLRDGVQVVAEAVQNLNKLVEETGAKIVLSSSWRFSHTPGEMEKILHALGGWACDIIDSTPKHLSITDKTAGGVKRGHEIQDWLDRHPEVTHYVIIDDDDDMLEHQMSHFVQTSITVGFTDGHAMQASFFLSRRIGWETNAPHGTLAPAS